MRRLISAICGTISVFIVGLAPLAAEESPSAADIQAAMNDGVELDYPHFQELTKVAVSAGGLTKEGDYLFVCDAQLAWKVSDEEFKDIFTKAFDKKLAKLGDNAGLLKAFAPMIRAVPSRLGTFEAGEAIMDVRFRARLERAGKDWIVTETKMYQTDKNPLEQLNDSNQTAGRNQTRTNRLSEFTRRRE